MYHLFISLNTYVIVPHSQLQIYKIFKSFTNGHWFNDLTSVSHYIYIEFNVPISAVLSAVCGSQCGS